MKNPPLPFGGYRFVLGGLNLERFLNLLQKEDVPLLRTRRLNARTLQCECRAEHLPRIRALADEKGWKLQSIEPTGLSRLWRGMCKRPGIPLGLLLTLVTALILSQFVWRVEIHNAGSYQAEIAAYLQETGHGIGTVRTSIDAKALERALTYRYPQLAWFQVYVTNTTLVVDVSHGVALPKQAGGEAANIVAARDGVITSLRVYAGTAAVKVGDTVQKGQVLIHGEERGADETVIPVRAEGVAIARCWASETIHMPLYTVASAETGRETLQTRITTPWFATPEEWQQPDYLAWNSYLSSQPVVGSFFPVAYETLTQREVSLEYARRPEEQVRQEAAKAALEALKNTLEGYEIIDKWVDYCMIEGDTLAATATAEWLMDIGEEESP